jgi:hypothetical protein
LQAWQEVIVAARRYDWSACIDRTTEVEHYQGFDWSEVLLVPWFRTAKMSDVFSSRSMGLYYQYALAILREERYAETLEIHLVRTYLLSLADDLRRYGAQSLGADPQTEFVHAFAAQREHARRRVP